MSLGRPGGHRVRRSAALSDSALGWRAGSTRMRLSCPRFDGDASRSRIRITGDVFERRVRAAVITSRADGNVLGGRGGWRTACLPRRAGTIHSPGSGLGLKDRRHAADRPEGDAAIVRLAWRPSEAHASMARRGGCPTASSTTCNYSTQFPALWTMTRTIVGLNGDAAPSIVPGGVWLAESHGEAGGPGYLSFCSSTASIVHP